MGDTKDRSPPRSHSISGLVRCCWEAWACRGAGCLLMDSFMISCCIILLPLALTANKTQQFGRICCPFSHVRAMLRIPVPSAMRHRSAGKNVGARLYPTWRGSLRQQLQGLFILNLKQPGLFGYIYGDKSRHLSKPSIKAGSKSGGGKRDGGCVARMVR